MVFFSRISAVRNKGGFFFSRFLAPQAVLQELAVAVVVLLELVIRDNGSIFANRLFQIGGVPLVFFPGFLPEGRVRSEGFWSMPEWNTVFFCAETADRFFYDGLFRKATDQKLVFRNVIIIGATYRQQFVRIFKNAL